MNAPQSNEDRSPREIDFVNFAALSPLTRDAIREWLRKVDRDDLSDRVYWDFNEFCGLWFRLRAEEDTADLFPHGKWATLQRIESLIGEAFTPLSALQVTKP